MILEEANPDGSATLKLNSISTYGQQATLTGLMRPTGTAPAYNYFDRFLMRILGVSQKIHCPITVRFLDSVADPPCCDAFSGLRKSESKPGTHLSRFNVTAMLYRNWRDRSLPGL